jgi:hypothetical protein
MDTGLLASIVANGCALTHINTQVSRSGFAPGQQSQLSGIESRTMPGSTIMPAAGAANSVGATAMQRAIKSVVNRSAVRPIIKMLSGDERRQNHTSVTGVQHWRGTGVFRYSNRNGMT